jgi:hypothetical protein
MHQSSAGLHEMEGALEVDRQADAAASPVLI